MEGILQGTQQKLEKVQLALESEMEVREIRKAKYVSTISEQRKCNSLLKTLQVWTISGMISRKATVYIITFGIHLQLGF
nr:coiled-coil domain-containing protein 93 [Ipomoea trifida]GMD89901.1 coiled-coil domain-containing protein 93 isoform X2 [Ipomoea batatas]GMD92211.1 coiled-coil domain-containing protein 93 isoform X2 [Ipomoea batatas]